MILKKRCGVISDQTANVQFDNCDKIVYARFGFILIKTQFSNNPVVHCKNKMRGHVYTSLNIHQA